MRTLVILTIFLAAYNFFIGLLSWLFLYKDIAPSWVEYGGFARYWTPFILTIGAIVLLPLLATLIRKLKVRTQGFILGGLLLVVLLILIIFSAALKNLISAQSASGAILSPQDLYLSLVHRCLYVHLVFIVPTLTLLGARKSRQNLAEKVALVCLYLIALANCILAYARIIHFSVNI